MSADDALCKVEIVRRRTLKQSFFMSRPLRLLRIPQRSTALSRRFGAESGGKRRFAMFTSQETIALVIGGKSRVSTRQGCRAMFIDPG